MRAVVTRAGRLSGTLSVPGDKSISHRAVLFGALARGVTRVRGLAPGADVRSSLSCVQALGVRAELHKGGPGRDDEWLLDSPGRGGWRTDPGTLDAGNSGTTARLLLGMTAPVQRLDARMIGDASLSRRPMRRVAEPLADMGARIELAPGGTLPARIRGAPLTGRTHRLSVASAQVKTALLLAGLAADGETRVVEPAPSRDHTETLLPAFGVSPDRTGEGVAVRAAELHPAALAVPGDPSSAAFFAAAAAVVPGARVVIEGAGLNPTRLGVVDALRDMGARIDLEPDAPAAEPHGRWVCAGTAQRGTRIGGALVPRLVDEIPVLAVVAACCEGETEIRDAAELRVKESDRLHLVAEGLRAMGADAEELPDGLRIRGGRPLHGAVIDAGMDHRIAMSFTVAGLVAEGTTIVTGAEWADISFPGFFDRLSALSGGAIRMEQE